MHFPILLYAICRYTVYVWGCMCLRRGQRVKSRVNLSTSNTEVGFLTWSQNSLILFVQLATLLRESPFFTSSSGITGSEFSPVWQVLCPLSHLPNVFCLMPWWIWVWVCAMLVKFVMKTGQLYFWDAAWRRSVCLELWVLFLGHRQEGKGPSYLKDKENTVPEEGDIFYSSL